MDFLEEGTKGVAGQGLRSLLVVGLLAPLWCSGAQAGIRIDSVVAKGSGCSDATVSYQVNRDGDFEVAFQDMNALAATAGSADSRDCALTVVAVPPAGKRLVIGGSRVEVASRMGEGASGTVEQRYGLGTLENGFSGSISLPRQGRGPDVVSDSFWVGLGGDGAPDRGSIPDGWGGECGRPTTIVGDLRVDANAGQESGEVYLDRATTRLKWAWVLKPCEDNPPPSGGTPLEGQWHFQYRAVNGRTLEGNMRIAGALGSYRLNGANWSGALRDLSAEGNDVRGSWQAGDQNGWVRFRVSDDGKSFDGAWGMDGAERGFWRGVRFPSP